MTCCRSHGRYANTVGTLIECAVLIHLCRFTGGDFKKYVGSPGSGSKLWDTAVNPIKIKKEDYASGVAASVLLNPWSVGYSSSGEVLFVLHVLLRRRITWVMPRARSLYGFVPRRCECNIDSATHHQYDFECAEASSEPHKNDRSYLLRLHARH